MEKQSIGSRFMVFFGGGMTPAHTMEARGLDPGAALGAALLPLPPAERTPTLRADGEAKLPAAGLTV